ncbi:MAG: hypothetical protein J0G37_09160 [Afipia sp.]|jgi:hypothetical protein|nr:hypothetical protein [Afipia sp.]
MPDRKKRDAGKEIRRERERPDPTRDAPFRVDPDVDGDFVLPREDVSEDDLKDEEDRRP